MKVAAQAYGNAADVYYGRNGVGGRQRNQGENFQFSIRYQAYNAGTGYLASDKKKEILNKFPALTEEKLDQLARDYDIEKMDSEELFELAGKLMADGIIPQRPQEGSLNLLFTVPTAFLRDGFPQPAGVVRAAPSCCYAVNPYTGETEFSYPKSGLRNLQYDAQMCQEAFKRYESYYTKDELERQIQLMNSKVRFLELAQMLVSYREEAQI